MAGAIRFEKEDGARQRTEAAAQLAATIAKHLHPGDSKEDSNHAIAVPLKVAIAQVFLRGRFQATVNLEATCTQGEGSTFVTHVHFVVSYCIGEQLAIITPNGDIRILHRDGANFLTAFAIYTGDHQATQAIMNSDHLQLNFTEIFAHDIAAPHKLELD